MGFLDALKGGGGDAIRQSASLTMVYLLEQNRKFEAYMRGKVGELEARVAAQQARLAVVEGEAEESAAPSALLVDEVSPLPPEAAAPGGDDLAVKEAASFGAMAVEAEESGAPPEPAAAPGGDDLFAEERAALEREAEEEEAGPPSWQAMLVGMPPAADPGEAEEAAAPAEGEAALEGEGLAEDAGEISSLLPDWSAAAMPGVEALLDGGAAEDTDETDSLLPDWSTAGEETALEGEGPVEDTDETDLLPPDRPATEEETAPEGEEAVEDDGAWESPLSTGRVEEWA